MSTSGDQPAWQLQHTDLEEQLLLAHAADERTTLVSLYTEAANAAEAHNDTDAARFYLTHAHVFALDTGSDECTKLKDHLDASHSNLP